MHHTNVPAYLTTELRSSDAYGAQYRQRVAEHTGTQIREGDRHITRTESRSLLRAAQSATRRSSGCLAIGFTSGFIKAATEEIHWLDYFWCMLPFIKDQNKKG